jgi:transcriptional regulator with XRE-family HTH domain
MAEFNHMMAINGLSKSQLARKSGMSNGHLYRVLQGKEPLTTNTAKKIADALNLTVQELFTFSA